MTNENDKSSALDAASGSAVRAHTPGPWNIYEIFEARYGGHKINICGNKDYPDGVASILWSGSSARDVANARLIAAAPDMADLLDWAETLLCNALPQEHCSRAEWDDIRARWREKKHALLSLPND